MDNDFSQAKKLIKKSLIFVIKLVVFSISVYFLLHVFYQNYQQFVEISTNNKLENLIFIIVSAVIYVGLLVILAKGWKTILEQLDRSKYSYSLIVIYLKSLLYKYLPGNVFHYANRQLAANKQGVMHKTLLKSNVYEAICLIVSAAIFSVYFITYWYKTEHMVMLMLLFFLLSVVTVVCLLSYIKKYLMIIIKSLPYYLLYFFAIGLICYYVINYLTSAELPLLSCISLYALSWIAGFIIPGAPGGIGVRESVFVVLSGGLIGQADAIFVIAILRLSTTLGEVLAYLYAGVANRFHLSGT